MSENCWKEEDYDMVFSEVKNYMSLYLFKKSLPSNLGIGIKNLFNLTDQELDELKMVHFLLSKELNELINILPQLTRNLAHSSVKQIVESRGIIRGKIDWGATYKTRYAYGFNDKSLFVTSPTSKSYDLEENQLLKFLLEKVLEFAADIDMQDLQKQINSTEDIIDEENTFYDIISNRVFAVRSFLRNVYFNEISSVSEVKPKAYRKAMNHRNRYYAYVARLYKLYEDLFILDDKKALEDLVSKQILKTTDWDDLYELYVFFEIAEHLRRLYPDENANEQLKRFKVGLLKPGNDYAISFKDDKYYPNGIKIHYQNVPDDFKKNSWYKEIINNYNFNGRSKRPDVVIEFIDENNVSSYRFVEVKRSSESSYIAGSVYKAMGYFSDFSEGVNLTGRIPGVLITWGGIHINNLEDALENDIFIVNKDEFEIHLDKILSLDGGQYNR